MNDRQGHKAALELWPTGESCQVTTTVKVMNESHVNLDNLEKNITTGYQLSALVQDAKESLMMNMYLESEHRSKNRRFS